jgi:hypothetical protein
MRDQPNSNIILPNWQMGSGRLRLMFVLLLFQSSGSVITSAVASQSSAIQDSKRLSLTLTGFNYTSRYIDEFNVNGQNGGNLYVSGPSSGGGGSVCCVSYVKGAAAPSIVVRWQSGGCMYRAPGVLADGSTHLAHSFYRELKIKVDAIIPDNPAYLEVHFYPDGHVESAITDNKSPPRLVYSKERADRSDFPRCPHEQEPNR